MQVRKHDHFSIKQGAFATIGACQGPLVACIQAKADRSPLTFAGA